VKIESPEALGIGVVYSPKLAGVLDLDLVDVLEVEPQAFWQTTGDPGAPLRIDKDLFSDLRAMPQHKLVHSVSLPVGNSRPHDPQALELLRQSITTLGAPYASEHLSFNQFDLDAEQLWAGFLLPPVQSQRGVENAASRLDEMRRSVGVPVAFETNVNYLRPQRGEISDGLFVRRVAEAADCGILLDLHNLLTNERNGRAPLRAVFDEIPRERVWEIHLAGGREYRGYWLDSHSSHIDDDLFAVARAIVGQCPNLRAIVFEIMDDYIDKHSGDSLQEDVRRLRCLWSDRARSPVLSVRQAQRPANSQEYPPASVQRREQTLGALALGRQPHDPEPGLAEDPASALYADLVASMRESALYNRVPFLVRLLFVSIGHQETLDLIAAFGSETPPEPFGAETQHFTAYVRALDLPVPHLGEILDLEEALLAAFRTPGERCVTFECDAVALLSALAEIRHPGPLVRERCIAHVSAAGIYFL
jgi:uncharacterized protein (UPF0276 family)